jgi:hypothetical protein
MYIDLFPSVNMFGNQVQVLVLNSNSVIFLSLSPDIASLYFHDRERVVGCH